MHITLPYQLDVSKLKADRQHPRDNSTHRETPWTDNNTSFSRESADKHTGGQTEATKCIISLALRSIIKMSAMQMHEGRRLNPVLPVHWQSR